MGFHSVIVQKLKKDVSLCKTTKKWGISAYVVHNIIKSLRASEEISVHKKKAGNKYWIDGPVTFLQWTSLNRQGEARDMGNLHI